MIVLHPCDLGLPFGRAGRLRTTMVGSHETLAYRAAARRLFRLPPAVRALPRVGAWVSRRWDGAGPLAIDGAAFAAGALIPGVLLLPTLVRYGLHAGSGGVLRNLHPHAVNPWIIATTLARFLSFASLEISRFIATDGAKRLEFFGRHLWLAPAAIAVGAIGVTQPVWMVVDACSPSRASRIYPELEPPTSNSDTQTPTPNSDTRTPRHRTPTPELRHQTPTPKQPRTVQTGRPTSGGSSMP